MRFDLHNHTFNSHDGFTTQEEIISSCVVNNINAIAITEHDKFCNLDEGLFSKNGIELINGCEFTDDKGAHIVGLFIKNGDLRDNSASSIIKFIKDQGGLVLIPHPFKPNSGYFTFHQESDLLFDCDFIELINGGWKSKDFNSQILSISEKYGMKYLACSDSHKVSHLGLCLSEIKLSSKFTIGSAKKILTKCNQSEIILYIDKALLKEKGRKTNFIQTSKIYQLVLPLIPFLLRKYVKKALYFFSSNQRVYKVKHSKIEAENSPW